MPVTAGEAFWYGSANMPEDNTSTAGGAVDTTTRVVFDSTSLANSLGPDTVEVVSSAAGDTTQTVTVYGRNAAGSLVNEVLSLNGTTVVNGATSFKTIYKVVVSASHTGTITIRKASDNTTIVDLATGLLTVRRLFYNASADVSGGSSRTFYEKIFLGNTDGGGLSMLGVTIAEQTDSEAQFTFGVCTAVNDSGTSTNRLTAPASGVGTIDGTSKTIPGTDLADGARIGVWIALTVPAGDPPTLATYTLRTSFSTT